MQDAGTQTAGLAFGGGRLNYSIHNSTEEYNGTSWTAGGTFKYSKKALEQEQELQTAALAFGGNTCTPA
jgi:hypothetical protein